MFQYTWMGTRPRKFVWERVPAYMGDERVPVHSGGSVPGNLGGKPGWERVPRAFG